MKRASAIPSLLDRLLPSEAAVMFGTAVVVGLGTGLGGVFLIKLIQWIQNLLFSDAPLALPQLGWGWLIAAPLLGALVSGPIIAFFAREAKGHGVPEVMQAIALEGGRIRPRVALAKIFASAACIGSGGSAGREGPIVQVGAALGSSIGQFLHFSEDRVRNLVACGAAAGIAATFNAPIAGVFFSLEIILGELRLGDMGSVVISAVTASVVARTFLGDQPAFALPPYAMNSAWELIFYLVLGVLAALVGVLFIRLLYAFEDIFDGWRFPMALKPAVGALLLGITGVGYPLVLAALERTGGIQGVTVASLASGYPRIFGTGFDSIELALNGNMLIGLMLALVVLKLLATSLTLGSGNSGGVFAPGLFSGAMLGGAFGEFVTRVFPSIAAGSGSYATVGMAAVFAAAARAPLTAVIIVFEMTNDYHIILPLMVAVVVSTGIAQHIHPESIYTLKLVRRGIRLARGRDVDVMDSVKVEEIMRRNPVTVYPSMPASALGDLFLQTNSHGFPVVDKAGRLKGIVSLTDLRSAIEAAPQGKPLKVKNVANQNLVVTYPDESVRMALRRMAPRDLSRLPVVSREDPTKLLGVVRRNDVIRAYEIGTLRRSEAQPGSELTRFPGARAAQFQVQPGAKAAGKALKDAGLPRECVVISISRDGDLVIPHGDTQLMPLDQVTVLLKGCEPASLVRLLEEKQESPAD
jgi:CIC family chloride channel protein